jgi:hypothetical protein
MDIKGLQTLNHIGTFVFRAFGCILPVYLMLVDFIYYSDSYIFIPGIIITNIWIIGIFILAEFLYKNTVVGLDYGDYESAKTWILIGIIIGFIGGIIPIIIFIISYVSFDDAVRTQYIDNSDYEYPQQLNQIRYCNNCKRQIPFDSRLCPYCGFQQVPANQNKIPIHPPTKQVIER